LREEAARLRKGAGVTDRDDDLDGSSKSSKSTDSPYKSTPITSPPSPSSSASAKSEPVDETDTRTPEEKLADTRKKLDELIGLDSIKQSIQTLTNFLKMEKQREAAGCQRPRRVCTCRSWEIQERAKRRSRESLRRSMVRSVS
jgi:hypothetical protein